MNTRKIKLLFTLIIWVASDQFAQSQTLEKILRATEERDLVLQQAQWTYHEMNGPLLYPGSTNEFVYTPIQWMHNVSNNPSNGSLSSLDYKEKIELLEQAISILEITIHGFYTASGKPETLSNWRLGDSNLSAHLVGLYDYGYNVQHGYNSVDLSYGNNFAEGIKYAVRLINLCKYTPYPMISNIRNGEKLSPTSGDYPLDISQFNEVSPAYRVTLGGYPWGAATYHHTIYNVRGIVDENTGNNISILGNFHDRFSLTTYLNDDSWRIDGDLHLFHGNCFFVQGEDNEVTGYPNGYSAKSGFTYYDSIHSTGESHIGSINNTFTATSISNPSNMGYEFGDLEGVAIAGDWFLMQEYTDSSDWEFLNDKNQTTHQRYLVHRNYLIDGSVERNRWEFGLNNSFYAKSSESKHHEDNYTGEGEDEECSTAVLGLHRENWALEPFGSSFTNHNVSYLLDCGDSDRFFDIFSGTPFVALNFLEK